jgi:pseudaminic acid biosynthesis-associated methylase
MHPRTKQLEVWTSEFGRAFTDRSPQSPEEMDALWEKLFKVRKTDTFCRFLSPERLPSGRVLEVGCNVAAQLGVLQMVNPQLELWGLDPQAYALEKARQQYPNMTFVDGTAFDLPFEDGHFDLIMTNAVLIHIHPSDIPAALAEIYRCTRRYIFCHEYFSESLCELPYRGENGLLWKMNYMEQYMKLFPDLRCVEECYLRYSEADDLVDQVVLLEKPVCEVDTSAHSNGSKRI